MKGSIKENIFIIINAFWHNSCFHGGTDGGSGVGTDGGGDVGTDGGGGIGTDGGGVGTDGGGGGIGTYADAIAVEHFLFISGFMFNIPVT